MLWSHASGGSFALEELYLYHNPYIGDVGAQAPLIATGCWKITQIPGLVNIQKLWKITIFNGKKLTISMAIFNSYVKLPESMYYT